MLWLILGNAVLIVGSASPSSDACRKICDHYSADRRGQGFTLCDEPQLSRCYDQSDYSVCANLYWAETEDGQLGLVYSAAGEELSEQDRSRPLSCTQAEAMVAAWESLPTSYLDTALQIFIHLPEVMALLNGPIPTDQNSHMQFLLLEYIAGMNRIHDDLITVGSSERVRQYIEHLGGCPVDMQGRTPLVVVGAITGLSHQLTQITNAFRIHTRGHRVCTTCGLSHWADSAPGFMVSYNLFDRMDLDVSDLVHDLERINLDNATCVSCNSSQPVAFRRELRTNNFLIIQLERYHAETARFSNATVSFSETVETQNGSRFRLISLAHLDESNEHFADILISDEWHRFSRFMIEPLLHVANVSHTVQTLIYHRI